MKIISAIFINIKKFKHRTGKAMFLVIPISILVAVGVVISSQVDNIEAALSKYVFEKIKDESTVIELNYQVNQNKFGNSSSREKNFMAFQTGFTNTDLANILALDNVEDASINYSIPITNIKTKDLFDNKTINLSNVVALDEGMAGVYTSEDFVFTEGDVVPIIVNANSFVETYEDWQGKDTITIEPPSRDSNKISKDSGTPFENNSPIKTQAISYNKNDLIGKTFTITFGGLSEISDVEMSRSAGTMAFTKLSEEEVASLYESRKETISKYWDYDKLSAGVTYTFKVVGVIEEEGSQANYVPENFAKYVVKQYIQNQLDARNNTELSTDLLNSTFTGLTYDGSELTSNSTFMGGGMMGPGGMGEMRPPGGQGSTNSSSTNSNTEESESYEIPGLVIKVSESNNKTVEGVYADSSVFNDTVKRGSTISIKIDSILSRSSVVKSLNDAGYAYQDVNNLDVFDEIQGTLNKISVGAIAAFIILSALVIMLTMSKFVSDSTKEIGIFRAIGFTKANILQIFLLQSIIYTGIGYIAGLGLGFILNLISSKFIYIWFNNFISNTVNQTFSVVKTVDSNIFVQLNLNSVFILSGILLGIVIIISYIPSLKASSISPVEAIKSE